jgi:hypothetical protein
MTVIRARATDGEIEALEPILDELLAMMAPFEHRMFRAAKAAGARTRVLTVKNIDVDLIELARYIRARSAAGVGARVIEAGAAE